nr:retrovirus-related Pol polyprotein from transposon TNT 1-94 [Tanacetum cinerariifolium]
LKTPMEMWTEKPIKHSDLYVFRSPVQNLKNEEGDSTTRESTSIQIKKEFQSNDSFEAAPQHKMNEANESQAPATRTLNHEKRRPWWHSDYVIESNVAYCLFIEEEEPSTLQKALNNLDASFWKEEMQEEIEAFHTNKTWELVPLPRGDVRRSRRGKYTLSGVNLHIPPSEPTVSDLNHLNFFNFDYLDDHPDIPNDEERSDPSPNRYGTLSCHSDSTFEPLNENDGGHSQGPNEATSKDEWSANHEDNHNVIFEGDESLIHPRNYYDFLVESKVKYGLEKYVKYSQLSKENFCFAFVLNKSLEPKSFLEAFKHHPWVDAMNFEMDILYRINT